MGKAGAFPGRTLKTVLTSNYKYFKKENFLLRNVLPTPLSN